MRYDYITNYDSLKKRLADIGFARKNKHRFSCKANGVIQSIDFIHSVPYPKAKDYNIMISIEYPEAIRIGRELDVFTVGVIGANIGYLSPLNSYKVWRMSETDEEKLILSVIDEMLAYVEKYAIPFLKKYSILDETIHEIEVGNRLFLPGADYNLPIFYLLNGEKDFILSCLNREVQKKEAQIQKVHDDYPFTLSNIQMDSSTPEYRAYKEYKTFVEKIKKYIEQG